MDSSDVIYSGTSNVSYGYQIPDNQVGDWDWLEAARRLRESMPMTPDSTELLREMRGWERASDEDFIKFEKELDMNNLKVSDILVGLVGVTVCAVVFTVVFSATVLQQNVPDILLGAAIAAFTTFVGAVGGSLSGVKVGEARGVALAAEARAQLATLKAESK